MHILILIAITGAMLTESEGVSGEQPKSNPPGLNEVNVRKIDIMLTEYDRLADTILHIEDRLFAITGFLGALIGFVISRRKLTVNVRWKLAIAGFAVLLGLWVVYGLLMHRCGSYLGGLETRINTLADDDLLRWDTIR